jgi:hypothetical protein
MKYDYEYTDTFGGEANYCWVKRGTINTSGSPVRAVKKALGLEGIRCVKSDMGDMIELKPAGSCTIIFITWHDCKKDICDC